uniref:Uncharacterized protein n=1 Tax=Polaromonas sp. W9N TaxID=1840323 RepID=A0A2S1FIN9_9BURK|nr:hypothetical protein [Polaromonas sp. W9N]AWD72382.1 hypothetical protein pW9NP1_p003 [Polaromonas sp. W9N]
MKTQIYTVLLVLTLTITTMNAEAVQIRGARSCGQWISDKGTEQLTVPNRTWALGFLSGMAFSSGKDVVRGTDNETIFLWIDNYCRANPLQDIIGAVENLFTELVRQKRL